MKRMLLLFAIVSLAYCSLFAYTQWQLSLEERYPALFAELQGWVEFPLVSLPAPVFEFASISEFTRSCGAPYWLRAFTNRRGIFIQSRHLLRNTFDTALLHELLHWTLQCSASLPPWFEEGLVCLCTGEFSTPPPVNPIRDVQHFDLHDAMDQPTSLAYSYSCFLEVREILEDRGD
ncbi:MAG TPA: hypothetical protein P5560_02385 [Thermotogota bacterium]|nr:hypothetical protein [Thermotogota bacterium]HRW91777.1 hypothetical protein [Thermotogota bacterium]